MAVQYGPEHSDQGQRIISSGGNIYTISNGYAKTGIATRGRGFWVGKDTTDQLNPNIDKFDTTQQYEDTKELLLPEDEEDDGFDDNEDAYQVFSRTVGKLSTVTKPQVKQAKQIVEAAMGSSFGKAILTLGGVKVDLLLKDPSDLTEEELVKNASVIKAMSESASEREQQILAEYAGRLAGAMRDIMDAKESLARSIFTADPSTKMQAAAKPLKPAKMPPKKAQTAQVNDKGKVAYKYPKQGDGKGPNSDGFGDKAKPDTQITPPPQIDPKQLAGILSVPSSQIEKLAKKKTKAGFVDFFLRYEGVLKKYKITPAYLAQLYDSITTTSSTPSAPQASPAAPKASPQMAAQAVGPKKPPMGKSFIVFNPKSLSSDPLIKSVVNAGVVTLRDMHHVMKDEFHCSLKMAKRISRSLLRSWEDRGMITYGS